MRKLWIRFGCFITGYNYHIIQNSSEASARQLLKYLAAIVIISLIWGFVGFNFASRYLQASTLVSGIVAAVMVVIVIQIERQIILTTGKGRGAFIFRSLIGLVMAMIGSVIIDQILFHEDIDKLKITAVQEEVNRKLPEKTMQLDGEIAGIEAEITKKEAEYRALTDELGSHPYITTYSSHTDLLADSSGKQQVTGRKIDREQVPNPKAELIPVINGQLDQLRAQKAEKEETRMNYRENLEKDLRSKTAFLDEITLLVGLLLSSTVALIVWSMIFSFFFFMELFVLISKGGDEKSDYDRIILHQVEVRKRIIDDWTARDVKTLG